MIVHISSVDIRSMCTVRGLTPSVCNWAKLLSSIVLALDVCVDEGINSELLNGELEALILLGIALRGTETDYLCSVY
jgi:hypothetical protein